MASALLRPKRHPLFLNLCLPSSSCGFWSACPASELRQLCLPQQMRPMSTRSRRPATPASVANSQIKAPQVRLIGLDGAQLGVLDTSEARRLAAESNADLILVAPNASPPVAKLGSTVALRLAAEKKEAAQRRAVRATKMKEVRLTARVEHHDLQTKMRQLCKFLEAGRSVRLTVAFQPGSSYSAQEVPRKAVLAEAVNTVGMAAWADPTTLRTSGIVLQVDFKPTTKNTPEEHYAVLNKVGHALPTSADAAVEEAAPASASAPVQGEQCSAPSKGKGGGSKKLHIVDTGGEEVSASLEAYLARKAARSTPSAKNAKKGSDQGRRAASASAREPLSDDDLDRLGTRLREER